MYGNDGMNFKLQDQYPTSFFKTTLLGVIITELFCSHGAKLQLYMVVCVTESLLEDNLTMENF